MSLALEDERTVRDDGLVGLDPAQHLDVAVDVRAALDRAHLVVAAKYGVGDFVPVVVRHFWDDRGYYRWDIEKLGDCTHAVEPGSEGSYEKSQACSDIVQQGRTVGFDCSRRASKDLVRRCPWLSRQ